MRYLLDTDCIIDFLKGKGEIVEKLTQLFDEGIAVSVISVGEIYDGIYGAGNGKKQEKAFIELLSSTADWR